MLHDPGKITERIIGMIRWITEWDQQWSLTPIVTDKKEPELTPIGPTNQRCDTLFYLSICSERMKEGVVKLCVHRPMVERGYLAHPLPLTPVHRASKSAVGSRGTRIEIGKSSQRAGN